MVVRFFYLFFEDREKGLKYFILIVVINYIKLYLHKRKTSLTIMKFITPFFMFFFIQFILPFQSQAQIFIFPKLGYGQIDLNDWDPNPYPHIIHSPSVTIDNYKHRFFFTGVGVEQKFTKNLRILFSGSYSSKISYIENIRGAWANYKRETQHRLLTSDLSVYHRVFNNFSVGGGVNHLNLRNFKYPDIEYGVFRKELESQIHNYWGYHIGINYVWRSLVVILQYSRTKISKKEVTEEYSYRIKKIPLLTFSVLYKIKLGKIKRKKKEGCPTF